MIVGTVLSQCGVVLTILLASSKMAGRMDSLHFHEIKAVEFLQYHGMEFKETLQFISHLGGPNNSFLIYFPIAYILNHAVGLKILWAAVFSEWFNASLKW